MDYVKSLLQLFLKKKTLIIYSERKYEAKFSSVSLKRSLKKHPKPQTKHFVLSNWMFIVPDPLQ